MNTQKGGGGGIRASVCETLLLHKSKQEIMILVPERQRGGGET